LDGCVAVRTLDVANHVFLPIFMTYMEERIMRKSATHKFDKQDIKFEKLIGKIIARN